MQFGPFMPGTFLRLLIAVGFLLRGLLSRSRTEKSFFLRMAAFLIVHATVLNGTLYCQASGHYRQGAWPDLFWTLSFGLLIVLAGTWNLHEEPVEGEPASRNLRLLAAVFSSADPGDRLSARA